MAKTVFTHGTAITPEFLNSINTPRFSANPQADGEIPIPTLNELVDVDSALSVLKDKVQEFEPKISEISNISNSVSALEDSLDLLRSSFLYGFDSTVQAAYTPWVYSDVLPAGAYLCHGHIFLNLPGSGVDGWTLGYFTGAESDGISNPPSDQYGHFGWNGSCNISWITLPIPWRRIILQSPGRICLYGGPSSSIRVMGSLVVFRRG